MTESRRAPYRDDLCRSAAFQLVRADDGGTDGLTIEGYGAVFDSVTEISSWEGEFEEVIAPGAFKKSLRERTPKMQFDHGHHPLLGSLPLGRWTTAEEDGQGLHLVGRLTDNWLVGPFRDAIVDGGVEGMSFRFAVVRDEWRDAAGKAVKPDELMNMLWSGAGDRGPLRRTLREVKVSEAGPVVWPAYPETSVGVRDRGTVVIDLARLREPAQRRRLADLVALADRAVRADRADGPESPPADPPADPPTDPPAVPSEPQPTAPPADDHPATDPVPAPDVTDRAAGEHSASAVRPVNPDQRRELIRREYRSRLNRLMAVQKPTQKGVSAQ